MTLREKIIKAMDIIESGNAFVFHSGRKWLPLKEIPDGLAYLAKNNCIKHRDEVHLDPDDEELLDL